jgi:acyl-CoA thioester hydrolase
MRKAINGGQVFLQPSCRVWINGLYGGEHDGDQPVNAPTHLDSTPRLEDFPYRISDNVRFADLDPNQHVNNAVYATYFETGRVTLMKDRSCGLVPEGLSWMMVRLDMHFRAELRWPGVIEMGLGLVKFGRTSVTFDQVVFSEGRCVASAQSVSVLIDDATRKPTPLTPEIIQNFQPWLRRGVSPQR